MNNKWLRSEDLKPRAKNPNFSTIPYIPKKEDNTGGKMPLVLR